MADLFQKSKSTINEHIKNIYSDGELNESSTMRKFGNSEFSTKPRNYYNLDVVISVGYRVRSQRGEQLLEGNGTISHLLAMNKAETEYKKYKQRTISSVEREYLDAIKQIQKDAKKEI